LIKLESGRLPLAYLNLERPILGVLGLGADVRLCRRLGLGYSKFLL
jgi:hypothetical protein